MGFKNRTGKYFCCFIIIMAFFFAAGCTTTSTGGKTAKAVKKADAAPVDKFALFQKLITVTNTETQYKQIISLILNQFKLGMTNSMNRNLDNNNTLTNQQKENAKSATAMMLNEGLAEMEKRFHEAIPFSEIVKEVYFPVYDKYFTVSELQDVIEFYESPTGKKFITQSPVIMQEAMAILNSKYQARIQKIGQEVAIEQMEKIKSRMETN